MVNDDRINNIPNDLRGEIDDFFHKALIPYKRDKEDVWNGLRQGMETLDEAEVKVVQLGWIKLAAASIVLLIGLVLFMHTYSKTITVPNGQHMATTLPDGSTVELNAGSVLQYKPLWWRYKRELTFFTGEGYFMVTEGPAFQVISKNAVTEVLGTSFNIYARDSNYRVTCLTGRVRVISAESDEFVILEPNNNANLISSGIFKVDSVENKDRLMAWRKKKFVFTAKPLPVIIAEIERQYNININFTGNTEVLHTVSFSLDMNVETVLLMICKPHGLQFNSNDGKNYAITAAR